MLEKMNDFLNQEHTPLEKGLLILVSLLSGILIGFLLSPVKNGISMWSDNGNHNGNNNTGNTPGSKDKKEKKQKHSNSSCCDR